MSKKIILLVYASLLLASTFITIPSTMAEETKTIVYMDPPVIEALLGGTFTINLCIANVTDLFGWQVIIYYQNGVVNTMAAFEGAFLNATGDTVFCGPVTYNDWNSTHGRIMLGCSLMGSVPGVEGSGILARVKFDCVGSGDSILKISTVHDDSYLFDSDLQEMPFEAEDGYVNAGSVPHDVAIVGAKLSATEVFAGQIVDINAVSKNRGTETESFNVTARYNSHVIGTKTLIDVPSGKETALHFVWNTSGVPTGTYVIQVRASVVPGETIIANNFFLDSAVTIKPAYDLSVLVEAPQHLTAGKSTLLKATVSNVGWKTVETNVELQLLVDEDIVNGTSLSRLDPGSSTQITYLWSPTVEGTYTVKAYAPPIPGEEVMVNNLAEKTVAVSPAKMPTIQVEPWRNYVRVGEFVRVHIHVYDVTDLYAWQIKLNYDPAVLEFRKIWLPDNHVLAGKNCIKTPTIVSEDYVMYGASLVGAQSTFNGSGILCKIDFKAKAMYYSSLQLDDEGTFLLDSTLNKKLANIVNSGAWIYGDTIEITNVETSRTEVYAGWIIETNTTVRNNGDTPQTFSITAYFASEVKATRKVYDLPPREEITLSFYMDTSPLTPYIDYAIWAETTVVIGETWAYNNFFFECGGIWGPGTVTTRIVPDINGDTEVDMRDTGIAALSFGSYPEHPRWNLLADMNQDDSVDMRDIALVAKHFGKKVY